MTTPRIATLRGTLALFVVVTIAAVACPVQAADKYFDAATSGSTWDTATTANWSTTSGGPYDTTWDSYDRAIFEGTGGTVTLSDVYANYLVFTADGYTLSAAR